MSLKNLDEQEILIKKIKQNYQNKNFNKLLKMYEPLIKSLSFGLIYQCPHMPIEAEDLKNLLSADFYDLVKNYDPKKGMSFPSYIKKFLRFKGINHLRTYTNLKHRTLNYVSIIDEEMKELSCFTLDKSKIAIDEIDCYISYAKLSQKEKEVLNFLKNGLTIEKIALKKGVTKQSINYIKRNAINKLRKIIDN
ncbi:MAG: hypothetical protein TYPL_4770 [Candidatus Tyloplasma litorale]|nr:MAG: hypothetical protein TYPL_4770 [Mycoplasmatales bacterium]